jgi:two-component system response regulator WspF
VRVAIANDSLVVVQALRRILLKSKDYDIAWVAYSGAEALQHSCDDSPDVLLMGIEMPGMKGAEATRQIMEKCPCAILVVTPGVEEHAGQVFQCLGAGALDVLNLPSSGLEAYSDEGPLLAKLQTIRHLIRGPQSGRGSESKQLAETAPGTSRRCKQLVVIGASAGGPAALATILSALPADFPAGILVVQHIDFQFVASLSLWLGQHSALPVRVANEGDAPVKGEVLLAGKNRHLHFIDTHKVGYTPEPADSPYCPSVDVLFESASHCWKDKVVGVLLTGMGRDGARGLHALAQTKAVTIAQSAEGCAVFGMPKAAIDLGAAKEVLRLEEIAPRLVQLFPTTTAG